MPRPAQGPRLLENGRQRTLRMAGATPDVREDSTMKTARWLALLLCLVPGFLFAQAQGRIKGTVVDSKGQAIATAKIIMTCPEITNFRKELTMDKRGQFATIVADATKKYLFRVEAPG